MPDIGLSPQQLVVICALSSGATTDEAGVHRNTITNWRRNLLPFQRALADAQYDRALFFREKIEAEVDLAIQTLHDLLLDPKTPPSVRLKAALAIVNTAATPPQPKKQIELDIQKVAVVESQPAPKADPPKPAPPVHNPAQSASPDPAPPPVHIPAPTPYRREGPKIGRNDPCPCGSGKKHKHCCLNLEESLAA